MNHSYSLVYPVDIKICRITTEQHSYGASWYATYAFCVTTCSRNVFWRKLRQVVGRVLSVWHTHSLNQMVEAFTHVLLLTKSSTLHLHWWLLMRLYPQWSHIDTHFLLNFLRSCARIIEHLWRWARACVASIWLSIEFDFDTHLFQYMFFFIYLLN